MKKFFCCLLFLVLAFSLVLSASAHSGGTDSQGGHTDHSTGGYHWHHGYSAHQHTDKDGDGDLDCPYDFVDRTEERSGSSSSGGLTTRSQRPATTPRPTPSAKPETTQTQEKDNVDWVDSPLVKVGIGILVLGFWILPGLLDRRR